jgi:hypothetical protein
MANVLYCTLRGCLAHTERRADNMPADHHWLTHTWGNQRRAFCLEAHYLAWRATQPSANMTRSSVQRTTGWPPRQREETP